MSQQGGADFLEQVELARAIHQSEIDQIQADRALGEKELENQLPAA